MDHQDHSRGRSLSDAHNRQPHINQSHSPSPARPLDFPIDPAVTAAAASASRSAAGLGLGIDQSYNNNGGGFLNPAATLGQDLTFDPSQSFADQLKNDSSQGYGQGFLAPQATFNDDFTIFPTSSAEQSNTPLFGDNQQLNAGTSDMSTMASQVHHSPTPPHLLQPEPHQPGSAQQSPSFNNQQFSSPAGRHSRHASLGPADALMPGQVDWSGHQFQGHRRTPSEYSESSVGAHSPALVSHESFEQHIEHSPMQQLQDAHVYNELHGISSFSISDGPNQGHSRSPSHSPAISPRILPQSLPDMSQQGLVLPSQGNPYGSQPYMNTGEAFPQLPTTGPEMGQMNPAMSAPTINIDYVPDMAGQGTRPKEIDLGALTPPERGRPRRRAVTDPYNNGAAVGRPNNASLSPSSGSDISSRDPSRSLSPLGPSAATAANRRRQSTSAVPTNVMAIRLADPDFAASGPGDASGAGGPKRVQKHPATFQCTLCPKRFTRAYNLRSHLRTHTDERPFVCTVCGKAFARQHDRKRHEGLHSGEKKFVCKGDLKAGGQWGCGRRFARADALGRHFRSEAGRICIKPLLDEEMLERQRLWQEQRMQQAQAQSMMMPPQIDPATGYAIDPNTGHYALPAALLAQYPALAQVNWSAPDMGGGSGMEEDLSGRSSYDASDYEEAEDGGYVSGPGTGYGQGGMEQGFGEMGYASDYGGR